MKSSPHGKATSEAEVTNVSKHGFWIFIDGRELFAPFELFPWFEKASISDILAVERQGPDHLYWPDLDVDLAISSLEHPEAFPLVSRVATPRPRKNPKPTRARSRKAASTKDKRAR